MRDNYLLQDIGNILGTNIDLKEDIRQIADNIKNMFKDKYISKVHSIIEDNKIQIQENPTKEITFLQAAKPFINSESHILIDQFVEGMNAVRTIQNLVQQIKDLQVQRNENNEEIALTQNDGVYEIDEVCMNSKNQNVVGGEMFILFLIILFFTN